MTNKIAIEYLKDMLASAEANLHVPDMAEHAEALDMAIEALEGKDIDVPSRKGVFIPDITVEMFRNASLEGVEELMASGVMEDVSLPSAQPEPRWIPCSERLPEVSEAYIVSGKQKYEFETEWSYFVDVAVLHPTGEGYIGPWQTFGDWNEGQETYITAWMELPDPYMWKRNEANED